MPMGHNTLTFNLSNHAFASSIIAFRTSPDERWLSCARPDSLAKTVSELARRGALAGRDDETVESRRARRGPRPTDANP